MSGFGGMPPKNRSAASRTCAVSTSPTTDRTALFGAYQVRKNDWTSSSDAASRSSMEPMVLWW